MADLPLTGSPQVRDLQITPSSPATWAPGSPDGTSKPGRRPANRCPPLPRPDRLCLEFGEWLRRRRRINDAKPVLGAALEAFQALRARPWEDRARRELRASGVVVPGALSDASRLCELIPQQRQILGLAAQGLPNREIAQPLFLSR